MTNTFRLIVLQRWGQSQWLVYAIKKCVNTKVLQISHESVKLYPHDINDDVQTSHFGSIA